MNDELPAESPAGRKRKADATSYTAASEELEQILQQLESGDVDLDALAEKVERAAALLATCRQRLAATAAKVKKITAEVAATMDAEPRTGGAPEDDA
jgi:exodeoxyribonuclease VII small subunit